MTPAMPPLIYFWAFWQWPVASGQWPVPSAQCTRMHVHAWIGHMTAHSLQRLSHTQWAHTSHRTSARTPRVGRSAEKLRANWPVRKCLHFSAYFMENVRLTKRPHVWSKHALRDVGGIACACVKRDRPHTTARPTPALKFGQAWSRSEVSLCGTFVSL